MMALGLVRLRASALQDKQRQKEHFTEAGVATAAFRGVGSHEELLAAGEAFGWPLMLKSRTCAMPPIPPLAPSVLPSCSAACINPGTQHTFAPADATAAS